MAGTPPSLLIERAVHAVVKVVDGRTRAVLGTGVVITPHGDVLTCHHVVNAVPDVRLACGQELFPTAPGPQAPERDLAIIRCPRLALEPISVADHRTGWDGTEYWSGGFHHQSARVSGVLPTFGRMGNRLQVSYEGPARPGSCSYQVDVVTLSGHPYDPGLSGAPVVDVTSGAVLGVITCRFKKDAGVVGFAVLLEPSGADSELDEVLRQSAESVPRYGSQLNGPGALDLCTRQRALKVAAYTRNSVYLPDRFVPRRTALAGLNAALRTRRRVTAVIGPSGSGKSTLFAHIAATAEPGQGVVLVRGVDIAPGQRDVGELVSAELDEAAGALAPSDLPADKVAVATPLTVLLDGLNEAHDLRGSGHTAWWRRSLDWAHRTGSTLVCSTRRDSWDTVSHLLGDDPRSPNAPNVIDVGDFAVEEFEAACRTYRLPPTLPAAAIDGLGPMSRHPLMLRLMASSGADDTEHLDLPTLLDRYVTERCAEAARAVGRSAAFVRSQLETVVEAAAQEREGNLAFSTTDFYRAFGSQPETAEQLVAANLFTPTTSGYVMTFDRVGEYLLSRTVSLADTAEQLLGVSPPLLSAQRLVFLSTEEAGESDEQTERWLDAVESAALSGDAGCTRLLFDAFTEARHPGAVLERVMRVLRYGFDTCTTVRDLNAFEREIFFAGLTDPAVPPEARLDLFHEFLRGGTDHGWRRKDWDNRRQDLPPNHWRKPLTATLRGRPELLIRLARWLDDDRVLRREEDSGQLRPGEATVADATGALLLAHLDLSPEPLATALFERGDEPGRSLLRVFTEHRADLMLPILRTWAMQDARHQRAVLECVLTMTSRLSTGEGLGWIPVLRSLERSRDDQVRDVATVLLAVCTPDSARSTDMLRRRSAARGREFDPRAIAYFERLPAALAIECLDRDFPARSLSAALYVLLELVHDPAWAPQVLRCVDRCSEQEIADPDERRLYLVGPLRNAVVRLWKAASDDDRIPLPRLEWITLLMRESNPYFRSEPIEYVLREVPESLAARAFQIQLLRCVVTADDTKLTLAVLSGLIGSGQSASRMDDVAVLFDLLPPRDKERCTLALAWYDQQAARLLCDGAEEMRTFADMETGRLLRDAYTQRHDTELAVESAVRKFVEQCVNALPDRGSRSPAGDHNSRVISLTMDQLHHYRTNSFRRVLEVLDLVPSDRT
ncbi:trypsin-like peptidase domain-containing protein [Streptomyces sp. NBC_00140]|uniref:trypsin-like peptidase domain-containing protein n=1 Tax=Streptomyces sp. NBC_00140 TaxID=2975664 RepID=UPI0022511197|nr:trypsin-like peptidase domain-containing protein [Streptomyces sp. NBC_00140]MCX5328075.1 trypsin-like peptidase domain-containing protein [Streptomyces sp. NBC_00140]